jgi:hypothetical protein
VVNTALASSVEKMPAYRARAECESAIEHRDLRRHEAGSRQLALGGCSVLHSQRQTPAQPIPPRSLSGFKRTPLLLFGKSAGENIMPNRLVIHVQPDEGITMDIHAKRPGPGIPIANVPLDFSYKEFGETTAATGYETLLYDCMIGDMTLFHRYDSVDASWRIVNPILDVWQALHPRDFPNYAAATWGPMPPTALSKNPDTTGTTICNK